MDFRKIVERRGRRILQRKKAKDFAWQWRQPMALLSLLFLTLLFLLLLVAVLNGELTKSLMIGWAALIARPVFCHHLIATTKYKPIVTQPRFPPHI